MQLEPMLTTKEVAALLNVDPMTICKWRYGRKPVISFVRVGRAIRYRASDVKKFIDQNTEAA